MYAIIFCHGRLFVFKELTFATIIRQGCGTSSTFCSLPSGRPFPQNDSVDVPWFHRFRCSTVASDSQVRTGRSVRCREGSTGNRAGAENSEQMQSSSRMKLGTSSSIRGQRAGEFWIAQYTTQNSRGDAPEREEEKKTGTGKKGEQNNQRHRGEQGQSQQNKQQRGGARKRGNNNQKRGGGRRRQG